MNIWQRLVVRLSDTYLRINHDVVVIQVMIVVAILAQLRP